MHGSCWRACCRVGQALAVDLGKAFFFLLVVDTNVTIQVLSFVGHRVGDFSVPVAHARDFG